MVLVERLPEADWLHRRQLSGAVRASINVLSGRFQGFALIDADDPVEYEARSAQVCVPGDNPCLLDEVDNILLSKLSWGRPQEHIVFALLKIDNGARRSWQSEIVAVADSKPDGVYLAAGHAFGTTGYNAVIEIMSGDRAVLLDLLLRTTDVTGVRRVDLLWVDGKDTRGMGGPGVTATP